MSEQKDLRHEANLQGMRLLMASKDERIAKLESLVAERDAMLGKRPCQNSRCNELNNAQDLIAEHEKVLSEFNKIMGERLCQNGLCNELNAARALLRDAFDEIDEISDADHEVSDRIKNYLDACDTLEGK